ncbi:MAG: hypothetical protein HC812_13705, partial [Leptolyngbya sp. RL_3_1]|nr:hypothetical protein [Leptolyngbya sp. RL_3_1]
VGGITQGNPTASPVRPGDCGYQLHAYELHFCHPRTAVPMTVCCPAPVRLCCGEAEPKETEPEKTAS